MLDSVEAVISKDETLINPLQVVANGEQAIGYLKGDGPYADRSSYPLPELVMLDLQMPRVSGLEVLKWIREQV